MAVDAEVADSINLLWIFVAGVICFLLQAGFGLLEVRLLLCVGISGTLLLRFVVWHCLFVFFETRSNSRLFFASLYIKVGAVRAKNAQNIMIKNLMDACVAALAYYLVGYGFA